MSQLHKNNPWSYLSKDHSFTAYGTYNTHFCLVCTRINSFVRVPLSPVGQSVFFYVSLDRARPWALPYLLRDRDLPLYTNSAMYIRPRISTERPTLVIVGLIRMYRGTRKNTTYYHLRDEIEPHKLEMGFPVTLFADNLPDLIHYTTPSWISHTWKSIRKKLSLEENTTNIQLLRQNDTFIIKDFTADGI